MLRNPVWCGSEGVVDEWLVRVGDLAPDSEQPDQHETPVRLSRLLVAGPVVPFFSPLAMSRGCTAQTCHVRDLVAEFEEGRDQIQRRPISSTARSKTGQ